MLFDINISAMEGIFKGLDKLWFNLNCTIDFPAGILLYLVFLWSPPEKLRPSTYLVFYIALQLYMLCFALHSTDSKGKGDSCLFGISFFIKKSENWSLEVKKEEESLGDQVRGLYASAYS